MAEKATFKKDNGCFQLYDDENEKKLHMHAVEMLALRTGSSFEDVIRIYEIVLRRFKRASKVKDFLPILVGRKVEYLMDIYRNKKENNKK
jgi:hypothetical protein